MNEPDYEQMEQENRLWPWLADDSMADTAEDREGLAWENEE
jgi:hypothetical protein